ncbi:MAG: helix-turn-helix domain-containing protein, partial [Muribaculaceae bacterium]
VNEPERAFIKKFMEVLHTAMQQGKIDYDDLAYAMSLSRIQLNRKIKAITGYTTTEYILHIRISLAKQLFDTTDMLVYEVALKCGIDNATYFSVLFKKYTGLTPQQYKARQRD